MSPDRILFVTETLERGGIQYEIADLARAAASTGTSVDVLASPPLASDLIEALSGSARVTAWPRWRAIWPGPPRVAPPDLIVATSLASVVVASVACGERSALRGVLWVLHPLELVFRPPYLGATSRMAARLVAGIPGWTIAFANAAMRARTADHYRSERLHEAPLVSLGVTESGVRRQRAHDHVVVAGRLVDFKRYVLDVPALARALADEGTPTRFTVVGDGPLRSRLADACRATRTEALVRLAGELPRPALLALFAEATAVLAMGRTALDASASGAPTLVMIEAEPGLHCLGWMADLPAGTLGERNSPGPRYQTLELLRAARTGAIAPAPTSVPTHHHVLAQLTALAPDAAPPPFSARDLRATFLDKARWRLWRAFQVPPYRTSRYDDSPRG